MVERWKKLVHKATADVAKKRAEGKKTRRQWPAGQKMGLMNKNPTEKKKKKDAHQGRTSRIEPKIPAGEKRSSQKGLKVRKKLYPKTSH